MLVAALELAAVFRVRKLPLRLRSRRIRRRLTCSSFVCPFSGPSPHVMVGSRPYFVHRAHSTQGGKKRSPRLFTTHNGMATYIQWQHIPKRSLQINKTMVNVQKGPRPDLVPSDHPSLGTTIFKYYSALASRPRTSYTHNFPTNYQNRVL